MTKEEEEGGGGETEACKDTYWNQQEHIWSQEY